MAFVNNVWIMYKISITQIQVDKHQTSGKLKNVYKFENLGHSDLVVSACLGLVSIHICVKYGGRMNNRTNRRGNCRETEKWLPFEKCISY